MDEVGCGWTNGNLFKQQSFLDTRQLKTEAAYSVVGFVCMCVCVHACMHACVRVERGEGDGGI